MNILRRIQLSAVVGGKTVVSLLILLAVATLNECRRLMNISVMRMTVLTITGSCSMALKGSRRRQQLDKGAMMKNYIRFATAFFGLAILATAARGQASDQLIVNIPYEFVVAGKTLPAGTYRVNRVSVSDQKELVIGSYENREAVFIFSSNVANRIRTGQPRVTFQQAGGQHFLSKIETAEHTFTIPVSSSAVLEAAMKRQSGPASGSSGSN